MAKVILQFISYYPVELMCSVNGCILQCLWSLGRILMSSPTAQTDHSSVLFLSGLVVDRVQLNPSGSDLDRVQVNPSGSDSSELCLQP